MKKIEKMTKANCGKIQAEVDKALAEIAERFGLMAPDPCKGSYSPEMGNVRISLSLEIKRADGVPSDWRLHAGSFGLKLDDFGRDFEMGGAAYRIVGISPRSRKYPVIAEMLDNGARHKFTADYIRRSLEATAG